MEKIKKKASNWLLSMKTIALEMKNSYYKINDTLDTEGKKDEQT